MVHACLKKTHRSFETDVVIQLYSKKSISSRQAHHTIFLSKNKINCDNHFSIFSHPPNPVITSHRYYTFYAEQFLSHCPRHKSSLSRKTHGHSIANPSSPLSCPLSVCHHLLTTPLASLPIKQGSKIVRHEITFSNEVRQLSTALTLGFYLSPYFDILTSCTVLRANLFCTVTHSDIASYIKSQKSEPKNCFELCITLMRTSSKPLPSKNHIVNMGHSWYTCTYFGKLFSFFIL